MSYDPWLKATLPLQALGVSLKLQVPHDVFSTLRIDEGTLLLLNHLPDSTPRTVLDMGCGYGALGLPIAAHFPEAQIEMVDRDLLAVAWSAQNAKSNGLQNTLVHSSLGFRDLKPECRPYDWILCNVPARIGQPFIEHLFRAGRELLSPEGEIRVVVIRDLGPTIETIRAQTGWALTETGRGPRHVVYALRADRPSGRIEIPATLYARDTVSVGGLALDRPFDISGDTSRLAEALPVLIDALPRRAPRTAFFFRCGYGVLPLLGLQRWPDARVTASDRDVLATTFARENAKRLGVADRFEVREGVDVTSALGVGEVFDLAIGELSPSSGERVAESDLVALAKAVGGEGQALLLTLEKIERDWIMPIAARRKLTVSRLIARNGHVVLRLTR